MNEEEKNKKLIEDLKNLPKVEAPQNFEAQLWRKINSVDKQKNPGIWEKFFSPGKLFPGAIAVATAVLIFFVVDNRFEEFEDPLNIAPRLREDLIVLDQYSEQDLIKTEKPTEIPERKIESKKRDITIEEPKIQSLQSDESREKSLLQKNANEGVETEILAEAHSADSFKTEQSQISGRSVSPSPVTEVSSEIKKDNLNFMQINLSLKERQQVEQLKQRIQSSEKAKSD